MNGVGRCVATIALVWSATRARADEVSAGEERAFRLANDRTDRIAAPVWLGMQVGSLGAVFVAGGAARRWHLRVGPAPVVTGGVTLWLGAKVVKRLVGRGRPRQHLDDVCIRGAEATGLGYPSGHAAIATMLALTTTRPGAVRRLALALAGATGISRMYVGAHLPLDVVGGLAFGALAAEAVEAARADDTVQHVAGRRGAR